MNQLAKLKVNPGDVVVSDFGMYQHWSIVTDRVCESGNPILISANSRTGTVMEEPWHIVTQGKHTYVANVSHSKSIQNILTDARSQVGKWKYSVTSKNCEHFVKWAADIKVSSSQVVAGVGGAVAGATLVGMIAEKPNLAKFLGGALVLGGIAVAVTKAAQRVE